MEPIAGIDHVIVGVRDLEAARDRWRRLGFALSPRGRHLEQPTGNYCIMFAADYIELLGLVDPPAAGAHRLGEFLAWREGPMGVALAPTGSAEEARAALIERGLSPTPPRPLSRITELPQGNVQPRFSLVSLPPEQTPGLDCFLCSHLNPELMRRAEWLDHPNGATGLAAIHIVVDDASALLPAYDRLFGIAKVTTTDAVAAVHIGRHRLVFSTPDDFVTMHPGAPLDRDFALPGIAAIELLIRQRTTAAAYLAQHGIAPGELPDGTLAIPAGEATGAILLLRES